MSQERCIKCGQFANTRHNCANILTPRSVTLPAGKSMRPQELVTANVMKPHEVISCLRLMSTAVGAPIEGGRSEFAQKQARIALEQRFGKIDWNS